MNTSGWPGALNDDRVELIDGYLVTKMGKKPPHVWSVDCLDELFRALLIGAALCVRKENPLRIVEFDEPEPDVVIARGRRATYRGARSGTEGRLRWSSRFPRPPTIATGATSGSRMPRAASRSTGLSTSSIRPRCGLRSTPIRARTVIHASGLQVGRSNPGRHRRPAVPTDRRRRHPPMITAPRGHHHDGLLQDGRLGGIESDARQSPAPVSM